MDIKTHFEIAGVVPGEADMRKSVAAMVGEESTDTVHLAAFLTVAKKLVTERRYEQIYNKTTIH